MIQASAKLQDGLYIRGSAQWMISEVSITPTSAPLNKKHTVQIGQLNIKVTSLKNNIETT